MTQRERYFAVHEGRQPDRLPWIANMDHWFSVNSAGDTLPEQYRGWSQYDIHTDIGTSVWQRVKLVRPVIDPSVKEREIHRDDLIIAEQQTPVGTVVSAYRTADDSANTQFQVEWAIKSQEDFRAATYILESTHYEPDFSASAVDNEIGDRGVTLGIVGIDPLIAARHLMGIEYFSLAMYDCPQEMDALLQLLMKKSLEQIGIAADGPCRLLTIGSNIEAQTISPTLFERYALPYLQQASKILHEYNKFAEYHFDGFVRPLLPLISKSGLDSIEAFTPVPQGDVTIEEVLDALPKSIIVQGGIPSCALVEMFPWDEFENLVRRVIDAGKSTGRVIVGLGDNAPPDVDLSRLRRITEIVDESGKL